MCVWGNLRRTHLRDHLAEDLPKGRFHSTPYSCTLVLMSRASGSACSSDGEGDTELDLEVNILPRLGWLPPTTTTTPCPGPGTGTGGRLGARPGGSVAWICCVGARADLERLACGVRALGAHLRAAPARDDSGPGKAGQDRNSSSPWHCPPLPLEPQF